MSGEKKELLRVIPYEQSLEIHVYGGMSLEKSDAPVLFSADIIP